MEARGSRPTSPAFTSATFGDTVGSDDDGTMNTQSGDELTVSYVDALTTDAGDYHYGRVDINTARPETLAALPGIVSASYAMPDAHWGYGFPIGGVAAFDAADGGVISAGGVGFDISCGVRTLHTGLTHEQLRPHTRALADLLAAVKRVSLLGSDQFGRAVQLALSKQKLELSSKTEVGEAEEIGAGHGGGLGRGFGPTVLDTGGCGGNKRDPGGPQHLPAVSGLS